ncbi:MAG: hypothetical protein LHV69_10960, partial [Elusimicrobia bacterium]|nr:hypothetical protein [Candidatus Obscuribacterium magneticum]
MRSIYLVDTSAWLFALGCRPKPEIYGRIQYLVENNLVAIVSPIQYELLSGIREEADVIRLQSYLSSLHPFPFMAAEWLEAVAWAQSVRNKGLK